MTAKVCKLAIARGPAGSLASTSRYPRLLGSRNRSSGLLTNKLWARNGGRPPAWPFRTASRSLGQTGEIRELRARLNDKDAVIDDRRRRLDQREADRCQALDRLAAAQERIAALLTDQRPARRRWRFW